MVHTFPTGHDCDLVHLLESQACLMEDKVAFYDVRADSSNQWDILCYRDLASRAKSIASCLQALHAEGERILLVFQPGLAFIVAFWACQYAGAIAVPTYPPRKPQHYGRIASIIHNAGAKFILSDQQWMGHVEASAEAQSMFAQQTMIATDSIPVDLATQWRMPDLNSESLALLQYTSGSTGTPKGVMIQHNHLLANFDLINQCFEDNQDSSAICWLPPYHDMGLIGGILQTLYVGGSTYLLNPVSFLQKPQQWLSLISEQQVSTAGGPNFAYDLCVKTFKPNQSQDLDLSRWRVAFTGAEPIQAETLSAFAQTFEPYGFDPAAFLPCYGMAETTLLVSGKRITRQPKVLALNPSALRDRRVERVSQDAPETHTTQLVSSGALPEHVNLRIVDPETTQACGTGTIGEIWVQSPSVARGYWQRPQLSQAVFEAHIAGEPEAGVFLRTGDLGFYDEGHLFVTGRLKELMIIRGRNYFPQDIELAVQASHPALRDHHGAAFTVEQGGETRLCLVQEVERTWLKKIDRHELLKSIRYAIAEQFDLQLGGLLLIKPAQLPKTTSGKVQRIQSREYVLQKQFQPIFEWSLQSQSSGDASGWTSKNSTLETVSKQPQPKLLHDLETWLIDHVSRQLNIAKDDLCVEEPLANYGLSSLVAARLAGELQDHFGISIDPVIVYDHPSIRSLAQAIVNLQTQSHPPDAKTALITTRRRRKSDVEIAVVGIGCRFPGANSVDEFWQVLVQGQDCISEVPTDRWPVEDYYDPRANIPGKMNTRWGGFIDDVRGFDAEFFKVSAREAQTMDPQQRLLLEVTWQALENAGLIPNQLRGSATGVFIGICSNDYARLFQGDRQMSGPYGGTSNAYSIAANRLSYLMNWHGPSIAVDTACSSSLVAIHQACQNLKLSECDLAIAGGVNLILNPDLTITFSQAGMMSPDGRCKPFDANANGYVRGEGCGIVVLKRLDDALRDGNRIYSVIKGSAINQDGQSNGLTAPNSLAQERVIRAALNAANIEPQEVTAIEAHGTGTALGDPIEVAALKQVFGKGQKRTNPLKIGSVKSNIGHLEAAAGVAGFIKSSLSLYYGHQVPTLHFCQLNPLIDLRQEALAIATDFKPFDATATPNIYGISSFGFGGTNAHVILGAWTKPSPEITPHITHPYQLLTLSAQTETALIHQIQQYSIFLDSDRVGSLPQYQICQQLNHYRSALKHRIAIVAGPDKPLQTQLLQLLQRGPQAMDSGIVQTKRDQHLVFAFSGQGSQYAGMSQSLYESHPYFRSVVDDCAAILEQWFDFPILSVLYPESEETRSPLQDTQYAQPLLFTVEYALAKLWMSLGLTPKSMMGHSLGEYVAACIAGVFSLEDALKLVTHRGRLMQSLPGNGAMLATLGDEAVITQTLEPFGEQVNIAAFNGPNNFVISGVCSAIEECIQALGAKGVNTKPLNVSHGFHSSLMEPILDEFRAIAQQVKFHPPQFDILSNVTGELIGNEICSPDYWVQHIRQPVQFAKSASYLLEQDNLCFLEVGPHPILLAMTKRLAKTLQLEQSWIGLPSLHRDQPEWQVFLSTLAQLYTQGFDLHWPALEDPGQVLEGLPIYPFQHQSYWLSSAVVASTVNSPDPLPFTPSTESTPAQQPVLHALPRGDRRSQILTLLTHKIRDILLDDGRELDIHASFLELGADSINLMELIQVLEQTFEVKVSVQDIFANFNSLDKLAHYLDTHLPASWVVALPSSRPALELSPPGQESLEQQYGELFHHVEELQQHLHREAMQTPLESIVTQQLSVLQTVMLQQLEALKQSQQDVNLSLPQPKLEPKNLPSSVHLTPHDLSQGLGVAKTPSALRKDANGHHGNDNSSNGHHAYSQNGNGHLHVPQNSAPGTALLSPEPLLSETHTQSSLAGHSPLSSAQIQIWWAERLHPERNIYLIPIALELKGRLDVQALEASLNQVIERHESLRTRYLAVKGSPVLEILPDRPIQISLNSVSSVPDLDTIQAQVTRLSEPKFDLESEPLIRAQLLRWSDHHQVLILVFHHLAADAWSTGVLIQEISQFYPAQCLRQPIRLPPLAMRYSEFTKQRAIALKATETNREAYWRQILKTLPEPLALPYDQLSPNPSSGRGATYLHVFPPSVNQNLKSQCRQLGVTPYMLLLTAYSVLLYRYTSQRDLVIGSTLAGRQQKESHALIGLCLQTLLIRIEINLSTSVADLLHQVRDRSIEAFAEPDIPFESLKDLLGDSGEWFQTMFILQSTPHYELALPNLELHQLPVPGTGAKCPLSLWIDDRPDGFHAEWEYNVDCFSESFIQGLAQQFIALLEVGFAESQRSIQDFVTAIETAYKPKIHSLSDTDLAPLLPVHQRFEEQVEQTPAAIALEAEGSCWSYGELNRRANQIAHLLLDRGLKAADLVAIALPRSADQIAAILGILKAGGAYLPLDPNYPFARLEYRVQDAQPSVLIGNGDPQWEKFSYLGSEILDLKSCDLQGYADHNLAQEFDLSQPIYVIYTSGSTGQPKGTILTHQGVANFTEQAIATYGFEKGDRILQFASICFDAAVEEIFGALCSGASLILRNDACLKSSQTFSEYCQTQNISVLDLPTAFWHQWVQDALGGLNTLPTSIRTVIIGGERVLTPLAKGWQTLPQTQAMTLFNTYGPTEATVVATTYKIQAQTPVDENQDIPIGQPLGNVEVYVLNPEGFPVPQGVAGELYLGGVGLARGYLHQPEKTATQFVAPAFAPELRLYRTGDRVKCLPNGDLLYLGRLDDQVKVRGFRVELGEVENVLQTHPQVRQCAVLATPDDRGVNQLSAYLVPHTESIESQTLRRDLTRLLPDYMIPARLLWVEQIPLSPNGKVDRKALLTSLPDQPAITSSPARSPLMQELQDLWQDLLKQPVGIQDSFFALGGHSLLAMQLHAQIQDRYQVDLSLLDFLAQPTIESLAHAIELAQPQQAVFPDIPRVDTGQPQPLSIPQQRIWMLEQMQDMGATYHITVAQKIRGAFQLDVLDRCLDCLVERHGVLRTTFELQQGEPRQILHDHMAIAIDHLAAHQIEGSLEQTLQHFATQPFDLSTGPLVRVLTVQHSPEELTLAFVVHHIIADAWSVGILVQDMMALYPQLAKGQLGDLVPLPIQYIDFAQWQRNTLQGELREQQLQYWSTKLEGAPTHLDLPTDYPRPHQPTFTGNVFRQTLPPDLSRAIQTFSRQQNVTLYSVLVSVFGLLMHRYSQQSEIMIGTPTANRCHPQTQGVMGLFLNTLVLRLAIDGEESFADLIARFAKVSAEAFSHQDIPFEELITQLEPDQRTDLGSWFQVMFILQNAHDHQLQLPGLDFTPLAVDMGVAKFDLTLSVEETDSGLVGEWEYNAQLFAPETIARMAECYEYLLSLVIANPAAPIQSLNLLSGGEIGRLHQLAGQTTATSPLAVTQRFETIAAQNPWAIALESEGRTWSYQSLNEWANQIGQALKQWDIQRGDRIGVFLHRSPEAIAAFLGSLKLGACYVPLDPTYPHDRLQFMIADADLKLLIHSTDDAPLPETLNIPVLNVLDSSIQDQPNPNLGVDHVETTPAYLIYTSGSTGRPKGTVIGHGSLTNFVQQAIETYGFDAGDRILQFASMSFDAAVEEIYGALCSGATLILRSEAMLQNYPVFSQACASLEITVLDLPTAFWHQLTQAWHQNSTPIPASLRLVIIGGERALPAIVCQWQALETSVRLINTYGPTESTVVATTYEILPEHRFAPDGDIPIGRPFANLRAYVLDEHQRLLPFGVVGELYLGGAGLALEYWQQPELTRRAFVTSPFHSGQKLYRTGDRVRWMPDGNLVYLGRLDDQVKVRGFRVELGDVENVLQSHPQIQQCAVISQADPQGMTHLIAYVVPLGAVPLTPGEIRTFLLGLVPAYMVPTVLQIIEALPLTPAGKINRRSLLPIQWESLSADQDYVAPRTATESALCFMVAEVLQQDRVGIFDNFFSLGGSSLSAMQVIARIQDFFGQSVSVRTLLEDPTVAAIASHLDHQSIAPDSLAIRPLSNRDQSPLSLAQERLWFLYQLEGQTATYNLPFAIKITGNPKLELLERSLNYVISRHETLRTSFIEQNGQGQAIIHPTVQIKLQVHDCGDQDRVATLDQAIAVEAQTPFDLSVAPLIRASIYRQSEQTQVLLITLHHIIADGWSMGILLQEVVHHYSALAEGRSPQLNPLPVQYADYADWQRQQIESATYQDRFNQWVQNFMDAPLLLELPTDYPRPKEQRFRGGIVRRPLPPTLIKQVQDWAQSRHITLFVPLMSAYVTLLYRYSYQHDIVVGTPVAGRSQTELEGLIGFFINTLPLRFKDLNRQTSESLVNLVQDVILQGFDHQDIPFTQLIQALPLARDLSYLPLCQVLFVLHNVPMPSFDQPDLSLEALPTHSGHARFDLTLSIVHQEDDYCCEWEYNSDLFDATTLERMAEHYEILLQALLERPNTSITQLPLLSPQEQQLLLVERNQTQHDLPIRCIHHWIEDQVNATPDAIALQFGNEQLTYRQFNQRANQLAHYLRSLGFEPEQLVGLYLERSLEMWIAVLAVWKAGGAYVPLDPGYPAERLGYIAQSANLQYLIYADPVTPFHPLCEIQNQINVSQLATPLEAISTTNLASESHPSQLAYVIFTSGSTGNPKGVMVEHQGLGNLAFAQAEIFDVTSQSRVLQHASFSFDASVSEFLMTVCVGATLCLQPSIYSGDLFLPALLKTLQITHLTTTPALLSYFTPDAFEGVSHLIVAGEDCSTAIATQWSSRTGFFNAYGPTENSVCASIANCTNTQQQPTIGRPIANVRVYILDPDMQLVPDGGMGELWLAGIGLARGYWNRPDLTAERFMDNPHVPGERIYRTGDRVRYDAQGNLEYWGRLDHQTKLRGFRIELGEIEAALCRHDAISAALVRVIEIAQDQVLVGYVQTAEPMTPELSHTLEEHLKAIVPHYMIPSCYVALNTFPLTPNGKVNLAALPLPDRRDRTSQTTYVPPQNPIEAELVEIWSELLDVPHIGTQDNFFQLGGHSLMAMQLITRIQRHFGVDIPLPPLFEQPTIAQLSDLIFEAQLTQTDPDLLESLLLELEQS